MHALLAIVGVAQMTTADLPVGSAPPALPTPHFPSRLHAFVWRNWGLVPAARMASVVGARPAQVTALGRAMGLQGPPRVSDDQWRRSYITIIRRNWHLLPYDQLLALLDWTPERLAYTLREDDFLYVKLGNLKPKCDPLRWAPSDGAASQREREIAGVVREAFPGGVGVPKEPLFTFVRDLSRRPEASERPAAPAPGLPSPRYCYSYFAPYGDPLLDPREDPYPDGFLARLAASGVDGVWLQAVLYKLAPFPWDPSLSEGWQTRLANLRKLAARARKHGIGLYLYLNEPRAMPLRFFETRPELKGAVEGDHAVLCTSVPEVRQYLTESVARICREAPELGGLFTISASENLTSCWSHFGGAACPRCGKRPPAEVVAEVNAALAEGVRRAGSSARFIAWDWGWPGEWVEPIVRALPRGASLQSVSEWDLPIERGGVATTVGEYSISAVGPGPRASRHWAAARAAGLKAIAKIQAGVTWEMAAAPYVPAVANVAQHAANLRAAGVDGLMLGWTLGGCPSPNLDVVAEVWRQQGDVDAALRAVAERRFGARAADAVVAAWKGMSRAYAEYPYHIGGAYTGPQHMGPANLLWRKPTGYAATMVGFPYDQLDAWRAVYPAEVYSAQFRKVASGFSEGADALDRAAVDAAPGRRRDALEGEARIARACAIHFASVANQADYVRLRDAGKPTRELIEDELALARRLHALQTGDSRLGFEASNHYFYVPMDLAEKVVSCRWLLAREP